MCELTDLIKITEKKIHVWAEFTNSVNKINLNLKCLVLQTID